MLDPAGKKLLTLCFIRKGNEILLGMKKRGKGMGNWNGFGGKVEPGETIEHAAIREVQEEVGMSVSNIEQMGTIDFTLPGEEQIWQVHIFQTTTFSGEPVETDEMRPQWFSLEDIPYQQMWADDPYWLPMLLENKHFEGWFIFDEQYKITQYEILAQEP